MRFVKEVLAALIEGTLRSMAPRGYQIILFQLVLQTLPGHVSKDSRCSLNQGSRAANASEWDQEHGLLT